VTQGGIGLVVHTKEVMDDLVVHRGECLRGEPSFDTQQAEATIAQVG
jgi:hypothetical protein